MSQEDVAIVVDDQDNVLAYKKRADLLPDDRVRISAVWIENSHGQVLIAQRSLSRKIDPGMWGPAVVGTVEKGETYEQTATRELVEELGVKNIQPQQLHKEIYNSSRGHRRACQWFRLELDRPLDKFQLQTDEVIAIRWIDKADLAREIRDHPQTFVASATMWLDLFYLR